MKTFYQIATCSFSILLSSALADQPKVAGDVIVVDIDGAPIEDVTVLPVAASYDETAKKTNKKGLVSFGWSFADIQWVTATKTGYKSVIQQQYHGKKKPVKIILEKSRPSEN